MPDTDVSIKVTCEKCGAFCGFIHRDGSKVSVPDLPENCPEFVKREHEPQPWAEIIKKGLCPAVKMIIGKKPSLSVGYVTKTARPYKKKVKTAPLDAEPSAQEPPPP
jgi:hypothetical protein